MFKVVTVEQMRDIERAADAVGVSYAQMMEHAGRAVAEVVKELLGDNSNSRVAVLVGTGNNGGDGLVAARILKEDSGIEVGAYLTKPRSDDDAVFAAAKDAGVYIANSNDDQGWHVLQNLVASADVVIDALLGTGARLPIEGELKALLEHAASSMRQERSTDQPIVCPAIPEQKSLTQPFVIAVDCPSGLHTDTGELDPVTLNADVTVTFGAAKRGHFMFPGATAVGDLMVAGIGLPESLQELNAVEVELVTCNDVCSILPKRARNSHKGTHGRAMVVAGSLNYTGAAALAGMAAYRAGAGLVTLAVPQPIYPVLAVQIPEATWMLLPHNMGAIASAAVDVFYDEAGSFESLLIGPGLGRDTKTGEFIRGLLQGKQSPKRGAIGFVGDTSNNDTSQTQRSLSEKTVIDADGLNLLAEIPEWWKLLTSNTVLTPHPGEMARLARISVQEVQNDRFAAAKNKASEWGVVLVLKGAFTLIASPDGRLVVVPFATDALATAGTGDVLAGCIVGLMAQGMESFEAATAATYIHGLAGTIAGEGGTRSVIASDVLGALPEAFDAIE